MIRLVIARNPFDLTTRQETLVPFVEGKKLNQYFTEPGNWVYSINGELVDDTASPTDEAYVVVLPKGRKASTRHLVIYRLINRYSRYCLWCYLRYY